MFFSEKAALDSVVVTHSARLIVKQLQISAVNCIQSQYWILLRTLRDL